MPVAGFEPAHSRLSHTCPHKPASPFNHSATEAHVVMGVNTELHIRDSENQYLNNIATILSVNMEQQYPGIVAAI